MFASFILAIAAAASLQASPVAQAPQQDEVRQDELQPDPGQQPPEGVTNPDPPPFAIPMQDWAEACEPWDEWEKPAPPFKITNKLWYVGTCGITSLLVVTNEGLVLIDTGTEQGAAEVYRNLLTLHTQPNRIGLILYSHEHFDHVGGMAQMQGITGAPVLSTPIAAGVFASGVADPSDPQSGMHDPMVPAPNIVTIQPGAPVYFGGLQFMPLSTPGHAPGALSWQWEMCSRSTCTSIVYADSMSPISRDGYKFSDNPEYIAEYRAGLQRLRDVKCDILLTPHPSASKMVKRAETGTLEGGMTCTEYADRIEQRLDRRLAQEADGE